MRDREHDKNKDTIHSKKIKIIVSLMASEQSQYQDLKPSNKITKSFCLSFSS